MDAATISYVVALTGLGAASGIEILAQRRFMPLGFGAHFIASIAGLADIILIIGAFLIFPFATAIGVIVVGSLGTIFLAKVLPDAVGWVAITALVGAGAAGIHFFL